MNNMLALDLLLRTDDSLITNSLEYSVRVLQSLLSKKTKTFSFNSKYSNMSLN